MRNKNLILYSVLFLISPFGFAQERDEVAALMPSDFESGGENLFAWDVAISGDYALVGTHDLDNTETGWVNVYELDAEGEWIEVQKLTASDGEANDEFGFAIEIMQLLVPNLMMMLVKFWLSIRF
jgi:hypothetical protein